MTEHKPQAAPTTAIRPLVTLTVRTTHPVDYVLVNELDGSRWRGTEEGGWRRIPDPRYEPLKKGGER